MYYNFVLGFDVAFTHLFSLRFLMNITTGRGYCDYTTKLYQPETAFKRKRKTKRIIFTKY